VKKMATLDSYIEAGHALPHAPVALGETALPSGDGVGERTSEDGKRQATAKDHPEFDAPKLNGRAGDLTDKGLRSLSHHTPKYLDRLRKRFDAKWTPEPNTGCHLWTGALNTSGYSIIGVGSRGHGRPILTTGHRVAWLLECGDLGPGIVLDHKCGERTCVNQAHLEPVTATVNRTRQTERTNLRKITFAQVFTALTASLEVRS
jgi:hypothetical protein